VGDPLATRLTRDQVVDLLAGASLFSGIRRRHLKRLAGIGKVERYARGDVVFRHDDPGDRFFLVLEGAVRVSRSVPGMGEEALAVLRPGNALGEMALVDDSPRSADATAHEACSLLAIAKDDMEDLLFVDRDMAYEFLWRMVRLLSGRLRATNDKMTFLTFASKFE